MIGMDLTLDGLGMDGIGKEAVDKLRPSLRNAVEDSVMHLANVIRVKVGGPGAGREYRRTKSGKVHRASLPGQPPARDMGDYVQSWSHEMSETDAEIVGRVGSSMWETRGKNLEDGTKHMAPRPHVVPSIEEARPSIERRLSSL